MVSISPTPSFPGAWPDLSTTDIVPPLPDRYIPPENDDKPQEISPSLLCLSPRPLPELPSLSSSLSTVVSSVADDASTPSEQPCSPVESEASPACTPLEIHAPIILDLREPHSPDSAHFSPPDDSATFASPSPSQLDLSLDNNYPGAQSVESVATYLASPGSPSAPDAELGVLRDEEGRPDLPGEEMANLRLQGDQQQERSPHAGKVSLSNRTFLNKVKRFGGRVRKLFKARAVETKPRRNSVPSLVSPHRPLHAVSVHLPPSMPESPRSRRDTGARRSMPHRFSLQSLLPTRLPPRNADSGSRTIAGNRLSAITSTYSEEWLSRHIINARLPDAAPADVSGVVPLEEHPDSDPHVLVTSQALQGLGIEARA
ncbi:hypothetical protein BC827DRAFT_1263407 [Russula dissimulans]|nr:hypothetical protein BC827DRAFT_1263407 [Russula dissimulans]